MPAAPAVVGIHSAIAVTIPIPASRIRFMSLDPSLSDPQCDSRATCSIRAESPERKRWAWCTVTELLMKLVTHG